jgi:lipopolysaccharide assembly protein A
MLLSLMIGLIIGAISVVFVLQNIFPVTITFMFWEATTSLAIIILFAILIGFLLSVLLSIPGVVKNMFVISKLQTENKKLVNEIDSVNKTNEFLVNSDETKTML